MIWKSESTEWCFFVQQHFDVDFLTCYISVVINANYADVADLSFSSSWFVEVDNFKVSIHFHLIWGNFELNHDAWCIENWKWQVIKIYIDSNEMLKEMTEC